MLLEKHVKECGGSLQNRTNRNNFFKSIHFSPTSSRLIIKRKAAHQLQYINYKQKSPYFQGGFFSFKEAYYVQQNL